MKKCGKCKINKDLSEFGKDKYRKDGLKYQCKFCDKQYHLANKEHINNRQREYYKENKKRINKKHRLYNSDNLNKLKEIGKKYRKAVAKYKQYHTKLTVDESPKLAEDGISLEVKCRYCGKYFIPTNNQVKIRIEALNGITEGACFLYCSQGCKDSCSTYGQKLYPKGFKKVSSREVDPLVRQLCFERDNWTCQICGVTQEEAPLHCHHIEGYTQNPRLGNDVTNTITLCKTCHKYAHTLPGCTYYDSRCK